MRSVGQKILVLGFVALALSACGIRWYYTPNIYEIDAGRIPPFEPKGAIAVRSLQPSDPDQSYVFFHHGAEWKADRGRVGQAIADQLAGELRKLGGTIDESAEKRLEITVPSFVVEPGAWTLNASMKVGLRIGDRPERIIDVENSSPGNMWRTMNGAIAIAVIQILSDPEVRSYLADEPPAPAES
jgi:hypothetical protein